LKDKIASFKLCANLQERFYRTVLLAFTALPSCGTKGGKTVDVVLYPLACDAVCSDMLAVMVLQVGVIFLPLSVASSCVFI
jgi:hypothetical protein